MSRASWRSTQTARAFEGWRTSVSNSLLFQDDAEAKELGNHYHYSDFMNNAEEGSLELTIRYKPD
jgi:hypothetical protein